MSARILHFGGSERREAERLLPWLVNETLEDDERQAVERHVAGCRRCQGELEALRALHALCRQREPVGDPSAAFASLRRQLDARRMAPSGGAKPVSTSRTAPVWLRTALAASCAALVVAGGFWLVREQPAQSQYRTLGDAPVAVARNPAEARLVVVFDASLSQASTQRLLRGSGARIVNGPSDAGAYVIAVPSSRADAVRDALRSAAGVGLVEALEPAAPQ